MKIKITQENRVETTLVDRGQGCILGHIRPVNREVEEAAEQVVVEEVKEEEVEMVQEEATQESIKVEIPDFDIPNQEEEQAHDETEYTDEFWNDFFARKEQEEKMQYRNIKRECYKMYLEHEKKVSTKYAKELVKVANPLLKPLGAKMNYKATAEVIMEVRKRLAK